MGGAWAFTHHAGPPPCPGCPLGALKAWDTAAPLGHAWPGQIRNGSPATGALPQEGGVGPTGEGVRAEGELATICK